MAAPCTKCCCERRDQAMSPGAHSLLPIVVSTLHLQCATAPWQRQWPLHTCSFSPDPHFVVLAPPPRLPPNKRPTQSLEVTALPVASGVRHPARRSGSVQCGAPRPDSAPTRAHTLSVLPTAAPGPIRSVLQRSAGSACPQPPNTRTGCPLQSSGGGPPPAASQSEQGVASTAAAVHARSPTLGPHGGHKPQPLAQEALGALDMLLGAELVSPLQESECLPHGCSLPFPVLGRNIVWQRCAARCRIDDLQCNGQSDHKSPGKSTGPLALGAWPEPGPVGSAQS